MIEFIAEIKETKQIKKGLDNEHSVKFITGDSTILSLGALPSDKTVKVIVSWDSK